ncbi:MAG: undecaprenyldiphospho-muramoylpentapeptide beta-N-acetylglucosaminyltransferase [Lysobacterales bacterium CG02_land_8_20_14_3_00_62_12]|nr:MAG: undecaprenyldiphospho-muramoylpentapeptide beta-N-acetylglucosaminyltransferase [Xanthomonadales bacterium CG02_land_8_20_14_3_00_62_12]PJA41465.1 MAG: undecaprenyldiphospho-muramoylpentapeptide beta-N-acetylglucosaminyltransferase [Xanthomonadales bacterium CG_4_9_14_3_um_filter_62_6]
MHPEAPILILAGGTGGHIFPGIAVAQALTGRGASVVWLGSQHGLENRLVPAAGLRLETIAISGLRGKGSLALLAAPFRVLRAIWQARRVVRRHRPRAAISFGGFAAGPGGVAAWLSGVPLLVHEQNRIPGLTNRLLARLAKRVLCGFPDAFPARHGDQTATPDHPGRPSADWVGNPVRSQIAAIDGPNERLAGHGPGLHLLVIGGSQGARALNTAVPAALAKLGALAIAVRHQCGAGQLDRTRADYASAKVTASIEPFIADMAEAYGWADLVVCRAGALTLAELCAAGVASILVPFPAAVDDHQTANARFLVAADAALLLAESGLNADALAALIAALANDPEHRLRMAQAARALAKPDAAERVAEACLEAA